MTVKPLLPALAAFCMIGGSVDAAAPDAPPLAFRIDEGRNINAFVRSGPVAAHLLLRAGTEPRILAAFPAGNSGVALWFRHRDKPVAWTLEGAPKPVTLADAKGRPLHGVEAIATVDASALEVRQAVLSSVRVLRDFEALGTAPAQVLTPARIEGGALVWSRDRLDGAAGYRLTLAPLDGATVSATGIATRGTAIRVRITALTGEAPLRALGGSTLLKPGAKADVRARNALAYLSYEQKFLAGSWRFDTYFGRDTLMSLRLLMPVLQPAAVEDGIGSVLARLAPNGEVAHEEDIGEFAVLRNEKEGRGRIDTPIYDYGMVDDDFMLPPVVAAWLLDRPEGRARAAAFLGSRNAAGIRQGDALIRNLAWVVGRTAAFAADPRYDRLVGLKDGRMTGEWRDSNEGLGRGKYAYDVNAVFVPASLAAIDRFVRSGLLGGYGTPAQRATLSRAAAQATIWHRAAPPLFVTTLPGDTARAAVSAYARKVGVDAAAGLAALGDQPLAFNALSLDAGGKPVAVLNSDDGFALLFGDLSPAQLDASVRAMIRPFPAGLLTPIGLLVANPAYAPAAIADRFSKAAYHGTVVWSWQQAVFAAGLDRQLARTDLPAATRAMLTDARVKLWAAIDGAGAVRTSELWSWSFANGRYAVAPFGASSGDADESNAAQLWSTVFLALRPPARGH